MTQIYDVQAVRKLFPAVEAMTYLDSGFQTPLSKPVKEALERFIAEGYETAGPKSVWIERMERTRAKVAALVNASPDEIAFTKNTSESMNIAANALPLKAGDTVLMIEGDLWRDNQDGERDNQDERLAGGGLYQIRKILTLAVSEGVEAQLRM